MNEVFNKYILTKRPFVTIKSGVTLDGKIATSLSDSKWITSTEARQEVHQIRNENAAILVGANTVQKDNPSLTTRIPNGRNPIRVILDSTLRIPMEANVVTDREAPTWIFTTSNHAEEKKKALENAGVKVFVTSGEKHINLHEMLDVLGQKGVSSLLIEGGGEVNASFIENKLMDKIILYFAPKIIGGRLAPSFVEGTGITKMKDAIEFKDISFTQIGKDYRFIGYPAYRKDEQ